MITTPTPSLKIKLRLGGLGSSQPSVSSSSSLAGSAPLTSTTETITVATPLSANLQTTVRTSSTSIPGTPLNQAEANGSAAGTVVKKRRRRGKNATTEDRGEIKKSRSGKVKARTKQGTPSDSRQDTPTLDSQPTRGNIAMDLIKDRDMRPRKWRRAFMMITTVGGEMEVPMWRTDDQPRIQSAPNSAPNNSGNATIAPPVPAPIVKPPFDPARPFACPEATCIKNFPSEDKLASHTIAVHGPKNHGCDMCWKRFGKKEQLARHRKTHLIHVRASSSGYEKARKTHQTDREDGDRDMGDDSEADEGDEAD